MHTILLLLFALPPSALPPNPVWVNNKPVCPAAFLPFADESEALAGKANFVHCVPALPRGKADIEIEFVPPAYSVPVDRPKHAIKVWKA